MHEVGGWRLLTGSVWWHTSYCLLLTKIESNISHSDFDEIRSLLKVVGLPAAAVYTQPMKDNWILGRVESCQKLYSAYGSPLPIDFGCMRVHSP